MSKEIEMEEIINRLKKDRYFYLDKYEPAALYDTKTDEKIKRKIRNGNSTRQAA